VAKSKSVTVQDVNTGDLYQLIDIPIGSWPGGSAPKVVYECGVCHGRFAPDEWKAGCPGCAKKAKEDKEKEGAKHKRRWTLTED
jgi:hypothetical protein